MNLEFFISIGQTMSTFSPVKEELQDEAGLFGPYPTTISMACLHEQSPPAFLTKTYDMVDDPTIDRIVSWSSSSNSFVVWDTHAFAVDLIPRFFVKKRAIVGEKVGDTLLMYKNDYKLVYKKNGVKIGDRE